ncbi:MAG: GNAT family N-acetyltransferase [Thermoplasmatota archaeon]
MAFENFKIRKFKDSDYSEIVRLEEKVYPDMKTSEKSYRFRDKNRAEKCKHQRYIAQIDDKVIGHGFYTQWEGSYQPGKFFIYILIHPDYQGIGYGLKFYQRILEELKEYDPVKLVCSAREDKERAIRFIKDRDFKETMKMWEAELKVNEFDFDEYSGLQGKLSEEGIVLTSLAELEMNENNKKKLYELNEDIMEDVPMPDEYTRTDYERFIKRTFDHPEFFPEGYIIATKDDDFIGLSRHWLKDEENALFTGLTGVRRGYRGKGIATAMKVEAIKTAKENDIKKIKTMNETGNEDILHINKKMGFEIKPAWIDFEKQRDEN